MSDYDITTDENGCIKNGLRADIMRCCMENKNLLAENGSIYVGTGEKIVIGDGTPNRITIAKTAALSPGEYGEVLMIKDGELCYSKLSEINFHYDPSGIVDGNGYSYLGSDRSKPAKCCYSLKKNLYTEQTEGFTGKTCSVTIPITTRLIYVSLFSRSIAVGTVDFGFFDIDFTNMTFTSFTLFPNNYSDYLNKNFSPYSSGTYIYLRLAAEPITSDSVSLTFYAEGPGASTYFPSTSMSTANYLNLKILE